MLLAHRGLGMNGEMDEAAEEEAGFREWVANRGKGDAADSETAEGVAHGLADIPEDSVGDPAEDEVGIKSSAQIGGMPEDEFDKAMRIALGAWKHH